MASQPTRSFMTVEEYLKLDRDSLDARYEYIDGQVRMLAGGSLNHSTIGINVTSALRALLRGTPCHVYNSDSRAQISEKRYLYPDASVSCSERDRGEVENILSPRVVIEVLSPTTEAFDRGQKFVLYRACPTLQEYVLIDSQRPLVETFRREKNDLWLFREYKEEVGLHSLGISIALATLYEDVVFVEPDQ